ncbi:hypothetical protein E2562_013721 [Oryza meyeriana var. granulata]|uniref:Uncharacterized protein n=1 Tax=Oryza meyeriana var. granulata TaxID=110450 RepID=A0A6G1BKN4_9ORYZ|nr:hypothetical protein E2562_013721 [Oryza meyeriana var. granulata]
MRCFTLPQLAIEDILFVTTLHSHLSSMPLPAACHRLLPQLNRIRLSYLILLTPRSLQVPHDNDLLASLLPSMPPPLLPFALLLHTLHLRCSSELLVSLLPSIPHHTFLDLLHQVVLTAAHPNGGEAHNVVAVLALNVLFSIWARGQESLPGHACLPHYARAWPAHDSGVDSGLGVR